MLVECYQTTDQGLLLHVRLTPKSSKDCLEGIDETADGKHHLKVRVRALPDKGKANKALIAFLAKQLSVAKSEISLVSGATSRHKILKFDGDSAHQTALIQQLETLTAEE